MAQSSGEVRRAVPGRDAGLTIALLLAAVVHVTYSVATLRQLPATLDAQTRGLGIEAGYPLAHTATVAGWLASGSLVLALVLAIGFTVPRLRTGRSAWWIPLLAAVIGWAAVTAIVAGAWLADPAVAQALMQQTSPQQGR